jgi:hypothetical protein
MPRAAALARRPGVGVNGGGEAYRQLRLLDDLLARPECSLRGLAQYLVLRVEEVLGKLGRVLEQTAGR